MMLLIAPRATPARNVSVQHKECGVAITFSREKSGLFRSGGSCSNTSRPRAGERAGPQRLDQRGLLDDRPTSHVYDEGGWLHQRDARRIDQMSRGLVEQAGDH